MESDFLVLAGSQRPDLIVAAQKSCAVGTITIVANVDDPSTGVGAAWRDAIDIKDHPRAAVGNTLGAPCGELHHFRLGLEMRGHTWGHSRSKIRGQSMRRALGGTLRGRRWN